MSNPPITTERLLAWADGALSPDDAALVAARVAADPAVRARLEHYRRVTEIAAAGTIADLPASLRDRARALFARRGPTPATGAGAGGWLETLDRLVAALVFDSRTGAVALRDFAGDTGFRLAFESAAAEIDLQAERGAGTSASGRPDAWIITGQITTDEPPAPYPVALVDRATAAVVAETRSDEHGVFTLDAGPGAYDVVVALADRAVLLPQIHIE